MQFKNIIVKDDIIFESIFQKTESKNPFIPYMLC